MKKGMVIVMSSKKEKKIDLENIKPEDKLKYEIATELGFLDKVLDTGWKSLTAKESGRIGGLMTKRKKEQMKQEGMDAQTGNDNSKESIK
jgi:hypothetical protein